VSSVNVSSGSRSENESSTGYLPIECNGEEWEEVGEMPSAGEDGGDSEGSEDGGAT
jgi:hypothetical protein